MKRNQKRWEAALNKELQDIAKREEKLKQAALTAKPAQWRQELEQKIPANVYGGLEAAFCKGFSVVFNQGRIVIEKAYNKQDLQADHAIRDYAVQLKGGRRELSQMRRSAVKSDMVNAAVTTVEGVGLGILGVGMPDIVLFLSTLLKGIYETALNFGFDYENKAEQLLILKMMATALSSGEDWLSGDEEIEAMLRAMPDTVAQEDFQAQIQKTASVFSMDMLLLKFVQGIPVLGILGGAANPFYYGKVMRYVQLKYRKRYLAKQKEEAGLSVIN